MALECTHIGSDCPAASTAWAAGTGSAGYGAAIGSDDNGSAGYGAANGSDDNGGASTGPSPRDQPGPGLRLDKRTNRLPAPRNGDGTHGAQGNGNGTGIDNGEGIDNGTDEGASGEVPGDRAPPQNPANPATPLFPAHPHLPADPGEPGNPVTPTGIKLA